MSYFDDNEDQITGLDFGRRRGRRRTSEFEHIHNTAPQDRIWTMIDGTKIRMGDMSVRHRTNALRLLVRRHGMTTTLLSPSGSALLACGVAEDWKRGLE